MSNQPGSSTEHAQPKAKSREARKIENDFKKLTAKCEAFSKNSHGTDIPEPCETLQAGKVSLALKQAKADIYRKLTENPAEPFDPKKQLEFLKKSLELQNKPRPLNFPPLFSPSPEKEKN